MSEKKILLIDGHGIAFRAFYAVPQLNAPDGTPTNALVGFFNMFSKVFEELKPDEIYTAFDLHAPTFRHEIYPEYKATRKPTPDDFKVQVPLLHKMLPLIGIKIMERETFEADDLIGSAAVRFSDQGNEVIILASDKDILQVLRPRVKVIRPGRGVTTFDEYTPETFTAKFGFTPDKMIDYLSLMGDSVDNIPGVPGVGEKTAATLIQNYGSIESILDHVSELKPALQKKMRENGAQAIANRRLTTIKCDVDLGEFTENPQEPDYEEFAAQCLRLGMKKIAATFAPHKKLQVNMPEPPAKNEPEISGSERLAPGSQIPLDTILEAPRLALDLDERQTEKIYKITPEILRNRRAILAAPDGSWWQGTLDELTPKLDRLLENKVICLDAKAFCSLMEKPRLGGLWDIRTAWYLLHPDFDAYDAAKELGLEFSPSRAMKLFGLSKSLSEKISAQEMTRVMENVDEPLIPLLIDMERRGIRVEQDEMRELYRELEDRLNVISTEIRGTYGEDVNLNSPRQIGILLFEKLGLPVIKKTKTGYSTDVSVLEQLRDICGESCSVPSQLLEYRELQKMSSGFVQPLLAASESDGLIHSTFEALTTGTGRLSSRDPNMQNLPAYSGWGERIRKCLVPSQPDCCFVACDYSQIELRVLAHLSNDPLLIDIFNSDRDIHTETASIIFGLPPDAVTKELRRSAKTVSFGLIYGMSVFGLAARLGTDRRTAEELMDIYFKALPGVREYIQSSRENSLRVGYTSTLFGRRRPMDEISTGTKTKDHQKRVAINAPIQGTAADITKIAMSKAAEFFAGRNVHMVLQVHDSIVCECPKEIADETARQLSEIMEHAVSLSVPLKTETSTGETLATV